jgi:hypothetical protein
VTAPVPSFQEEAPSADPKFDFDLIGAALAEVLDGATVGATVIGIHGPWGSGKTTLMHSIGAALVKEAGETPPIVIEFNAWKYEAKEALWRALILRLIGSLREVAEAGGSERAEEKKELDELESSLYAAFEVQEAGPWSVNWRTMATEIASVALEVAQLGFAGRFVHFLFGKSKSKDDGVFGPDDVKEISGALERTAVSRRVAQVQSIEQFLEAFKKLVEKLRDQRRVVVLIDDLDRCLPESALEVFESIKLFLDAPGCGFVVAVDREVIRNGLAIRYARMQAGDALATVMDADEYIEKTIAISYDVPRLSSADVAVLIDEAGSPMELTDEQKRAIGDALDWNPRRVKRFINLIKVQVAIARRVAAKEGAAPPPLLNEGGYNDRSLLLKIMLIGYRYPTLSRRGDSDAAFKFQHWVTQNMERARGNLALGNDRDRAERLPAAAMRLADERALKELMAWGPELDASARRETAEGYFDWFRRTGAAPVDQDEGPDDA